MTYEEFDRYNMLADKVIEPDVTIEELKEFNSLLEIWSTSTQIDLIKRQVNKPTPTSWNVVIFFFYVR